MSLKLSKIEAECWMRDEFDRWMKSDFNAFLDMHVWEEYTPQPKDHTKTVAEILTELSEQNGFDMWSDFQLYYDSEDGTDYGTVTYTFTEDGELVDIDNRHGPCEIHGGRCNPETTPIKDIATLQSIYDFKWM